MDTDRDRARLDGVDLADRRVLRRHRGCCSPAWRCGSGARPAGRRGAASCGSITTRGDRLFISLLTAAYIHLAWLALFGTPLWGATGTALVLAVLIFRYV